MSMHPELKILLLEDNPDDAGLIQKHLQRSGMEFSAIVATNEKEFLQALEENTFNAVLADNALPQYGSLQALQIIKQKSPFTAFILVTGTVSEEFAVSIIHQGADDYIIKGNLTRLPAALGKALEKRKIQKEKELADKEMQELTEQLRSLAAHLQNIREEEQKRIAREIHDELGQTITALKMEISAANKKLDPSNKDVKDRLMQAIALADIMVRTVRRIASDLRPDILEHLGLTAALEWQSEEFEKHTGIPCTVFSSIDKVVIDYNTAIGLYRIYQEALTNIAKHAEATAVQATISYEENQLILIVSDNGKGFDADKIKSTKTLGLLGMSERALIIKATLDLSSVTGQGTSITVRVPG